MTDFDLDAGGVHAYAGMMSSDTKPRRWIWGIALVMLLAVGGLAWKIWFSRLAEKSVLGTARFADGSRVEIVALVIGTELEDGYATGADPTAADVLHPLTAAHDEHSSFGPQKATVSWRYVEDEPRMRGAKIETATPSLLLLLRGFDAQGKPGLMAWHRGGDESEDAGDQRSAPAEPKKILTRVDLWTGEETGWQPLGGPHQQMDTDPRAFCYTSIFRRQEPKLRLRFTQRGAAPVEVEVANPNPVSAEPWKAKDVLPAVKPAGEVRVQLDFFQWTHEKSGEWKAWLSARDDAPQGHFEVNLLSVEDASGNHADPNGTIPMLPGFGAWRAKYEVRRGRDYPTPLAELMLLADGEISAVGAPLKLTADAAFAKLYSTIEMTGEASAEKDGKEGEVKLQFKGTMKGVGQEPDLFGENVHWRIYVEGKPAGGYMHNNGSGYSRGDDGFEHNFDQTWSGRMVPGTKFKLGLQKPTEPVLVEFLFDPPPLPALGIPIEGKPGYMKSPNDSQGRSIDVRERKAGETVEDPFAPGKTLLVP